ncbi:neocarzinostatin apoprotein domain-containing protein [Promicromonospora panici]|uniref:neocarzinostatin apoprotein domain-containing protein n=1 Tax=Promicromonospora panici TaxID=2219658 RepID=UPI00101DD216|nr:neocarzinostatin apoprotein domain-containing protein [Promicromonospora panici]
MTRARRVVAGAVVAAAVVLLAACTAAPVEPDPSGSPSETAATSTPEGGATSSDGPGDRDPEGQNAEPTLTVRSAGGAWLVRGAGYTGGNQYLVQCTAGTTPGASALDECDMSTSEQVVADDDGEISATRQPRAFVNVGSVSEVDCTGDPCSLAVADLSDRVLAAAAAPLPDGAEPPDAPTLELSEQVFGDDGGRVTVTGKGYAPGAAVRIVQCAAGPDGGVDGENCLYDDGKRVVADRAGTVVARLPVQREVELVAGGAADCAEAGACVVANAWTDGGRMALTDLLWE